MSNLSFKPAEITHPWGGAPPPGEMTEVAPGVHWLRMPLPISLNHINLWLLEDGDEWVIIDTGFGTEITCTLWQKIFSGPAKARKPGRLISTHHHPDHFGCAGWLTRTYDIPILMTEKEWLVCSLLSRLSDEAFAEGQERFYIENGVPGDTRARLHAIGNEYRNGLLSPPQSFQRLRDGQVLRIGGHDWKVMAMEGHSEHLAALYCHDLRVFIPGDQILPGITPNISVHWFKEGTNPLADFLDSQEVMADALPADTLVLPAHKLPFLGVHTRIAEIQQHHRNRLSDLLAALPPGVEMDAWGLIPAIFPRAIEDEHVMFALGEVVAHLAWLVEEGTAMRQVRVGRALYRSVQQ